MDTFSYYKKTTCENLYYRQLMIKEFSYRTTGNRERFLGIVLIIFICPVVRVVNSFFNPAQQSFRSKTE